MSITRRGAFAIGIGALLILAGAAYLGTLSNGTLVVQVRDTPATWARLDVTFSEVSVHRAEAGNESGWVPMKLVTTTIDFMKLGNLTRVLALDRVPAGKYTQLRINVTAVTGTTVSGSTMSIVVPDGILKTARPFEVPGGGTATVTLDFDLQHSLYADGDGWTFIPVLGAIVVS